jgi:hypothetical protein
LTFRHLLLGVALGWQKHADCNFCRLRQQYASNADDARSFGVVSTELCCRLRKLAERYLMTSNQVRLRGAFFGVSALVLAIMWIIYMVEILTAPWV